jgi:hypothetical protein
MPAERMIDIGQRILEATKAITRDVGVEALSEIASRTATPRGLPPRPTRG